MAHQPSSMHDTAAAQKLLRVANSAYQQNPGNCSGAVDYVIKTLVDPMAPRLLANALMQKFAAPNSGWEKVSWQDASTLTGQGKVVIGGLAEPGGHGHVIVVLPGPWKPSGGY